MISCDTKGVCFFLNIKDDFIIGFIAMCWVCILLVTLRAIFIIISNTRKKPLDLVQMCESVSEPDTYNSTEKICTIVRGVPGIGKDHYVYTQESKQDGIFTICSIDNYFYKNTGKYEFLRGDIGRAERECIKEFVKALVGEIPRIYITSIYCKKWEYEIYSDIAKWYGYQIKIVELECFSEDHLKLYNKRSLHNYPMALSKKLFKDWEYSAKGLYLEPYNGDLPGDCLPFPTKTTAELDSELEVYMGNLGTTGGMGCGKHRKSADLVNYISNEDIELLNINLK